MGEIDERYKRGIIYTIRNIKDDTMIYVGSTINNLYKRLYSHKQDYNKKLNISLYSYIENNDWTDWYIELHENYPCNNRKELNRREGEVIREIGTINKNIPGRTRKERYDNNIGNIKEKAKEKEECNICSAFTPKKSLKRHQKSIKCINFNTLENQIPCDICGAFTSKSHLKRHQKSQKCLNFNTSLS